MAFYKSAPHQQHKTSPADRGSWDDEGSHYSKPRSAGGDRPARGYQGRDDSRGPQNRTYQSRDGQNRGYQGGENRGYQSRDGQSRGYQGGESRGYQGRSENRGYQGRDDRREFSGDRAPRQARPAQGGYRSFEQRPASPARPAQGGYRSFEQRPSRAIAPARPAMPARPVAVPVPPPAPVYSTAEGECVVNENLLSGRNPIREALKAGRDIEKLLVQRGDLSGSAREIVAMAKEAHVPIQEVDKIRLDEITPHHQGLLAFASAYQYATVEDMLAVAEARNEAPFLILLDGITDPHNLGAIIRSAECVGAHGVIVPERRSVGLTPAAVKASAGAIEHVKVARVVNLNRTIEELQKHNIWTYAVTMDGEDYNKTNFDGGVALVIGAEGEGISRLTLEKCDHKVSLPMRGEIDSLNASVAAGVMMYRVLQSRNVEA